MGEQRRGECVSCYYTNVDMDFEPCVDCFQSSDKPNWTECPVTNTKEEEID